MVDYKKYLTPEVVSSLESLELKARIVVEGFITGMHRSPYHGFSVEFAEYRQYRVGDELKRIDWKVYGRTDKYFVRQYEDETNLRSIIALDASASMAYASEGKMSKYEYASLIAAAISLLLVNQRDAVGLALYDKEIRYFLPPSSRKSFAAQVMKVLDNNKPENQTQTSGALEQVAEKIKRRGLAIILSDFFDDAESVINALKSFRHRNHEVIAMQIVDEREIDFKFGRAANFKDMESGDEMISQPYQVQKAYATAFREHTAKIQAECYRQNIDFIQICTNEPFDKALREFIVKRKRMR